jgi:hypothetical protein
MRARGEHYAEAEAIILYDQPLRAGGKELSGLLSDSCIPPHHLTPSVTGSTCVEIRPPCGE